MAIQYLQREKKLRLSRCRKMHTHTKPRRRSVQSHRDNLQSGKNKCRGQECEFHPNRRISSRNGEQSYYPGRSWSGMNYFASIVELLEAHSFHHLWDFSAIAPAVFWLVL